MRHIEDMSFYRLNGTPPETTIPETPRIKTLQKIEHHNALKSRPHPKPSWQDHVAIACSGGVDSLSLTWRMHHARSPKTKPYPCLIVDHGLRHSAAHEALFTAGQIRCLAPVLILVATAQPPRHGLMVWARNERYRLLELGATLIKRPVVALAHHLDDQRETALIRRLRRSQTWGLAVMAKRRWQGSILLWRPWLLRTRDTINQHAAAIPLRPVRDPGNHDTRYKRVWVRKILANRPRLRSMLDKRVRHAKILRRQKEKDINEWNAKYVRIDDWGQAFLDPAFLKSHADWMTETRAIHSIMRRIGGTEYGPRWSLFCSWWRDWRSSEQNVSERSRVRIQKGTLEWRITRALTPPPSISIRSRSTMVWDHRFSFSGLSHNILEPLPFSCSSQNNTATQIAIPGQTSSFCKPDTHLFDLPIYLVSLCAIMKAAHFRMHYGHHSTPEGWKTLPVLVRIGPLAKLNDYRKANERLWNITETPLAAFAPSHWHTPNTAMLMLGCPLPGLDDLNIMARLGLRCRFIN